jgi:hypothetical protein
MNSKRLAWLGISAIVAVAIVGMIWVTQLLAAGSAESTLDARRERIATMSAAEKEQLRIKQDRFAKLPESEQQRLRALHNAIESHPRHEELNRVMMRYRQWLRELTPEDRASLVTTDVSKRLELVQKLQEKQHQRYLAEAGKEMSQEDIRAVKNWMDAIAADRIPAALDAIKDKGMKEALEKSIEIKKKGGQAADRENGFQRYLVWNMIFKGEVSAVTKQDHERLANTLSANRKEIYVNAKSDEQREQVANAWIMAAMWSRRGWGPGPNPSNEDLEKELAKLSPEERSRISKLPPEQGREELRRKWFKTHFDRRPGGRGPGDGPPGPPFGGPERGGPDRGGPGRGGPDRGGPDRGGPDRGGPDDRGGRRGGDRRDDDERREGGRGRRDDRDAKPADQSGDQKADRPNDGA